MSATLFDFLKQYQSKSSELLDTFIEQIPEEQNSLKDAMRYSLCSGGKRIRPVLVFASASACGNITRNTELLASAVECIHAYSLIHDDLPAMDDDDMRRGQPTSHIKFNEATAILAGDALQSLAFELLAQIDSAELAHAALKVLAQASGIRGMVGGQAIDLAAVAQNLTLEELEHMHALKTGALIEASVRLGALSANATSEQQQALGLYAKAIGLAFQVQDDILDVTADTQTLGKQSGADAQRSKPTYVSLLGIEGAKEKADKLCDSALSALQGANLDGKILSALATYIVKRDY